MDLEPVVVVLRGGPPGLGSRTPSTLRVTGSRKARTYQALGMFPILQISSQLVLPPDPAQLLEPSKVFP